MNTVGQKTFTKEMKNNGQIGVALTKTNFQMLEQERNLLKITLNYVAEENKTLRNQMEDMKVTVRHNKELLREYVEKITNKDKVVEKMSSTIEQLHHRLENLEDHMISLKIEGITKNAKKSNSLSSRNMNNGLNNTHIVQNNTHRHLSQNLSFNQLNDLRLNEKDVSYINPEIPSTQIEKSHLINQEKNNKSKLMTENIKTDLLSTSPYSMSIKNYNLEHSPNKMTSFKLQNKFENNPSIIDIGNEMLANSHKFSSKNVEAFNNLNGFVCNSCHMYMNFQKNSGYNNIIKSEINIIKKFFKNQAKLYDEFKSLNIEVAKLNNLVSLKNVDFKKFEILLENIILNMSINLKDFENSKYVNDIMIPKNLNINNYLDEHFENEQKELLNNKSNYNTHGYNTIYVQSTCRKLKKLKKMIIDNRKKKVLKTIRNNHIYKKIKQDVKQKIIGQITEYLSNGVLNDNILIIKGKDKFICEIVFRHDLSKDDFKLSNDILHVESIEKLKNFDFGKYYEKTFISNTLQLESNKNDSLEEDILEISIESPEDLEFKNHIKDSLK